MRRSTTWPAAASPATAAIPVQFGIVGLRVVSWPLVGLITDGFVVAVIATCAVIGIVAWRWRPRGGGAAGQATAVDAATVNEATVARWLGLGLLWSTVFLTFAAPSLASVVPGLPNDHYHAFADPMVFVLVGLGDRRSAGRRRGAVAQRIAPTGGDPCGRGGRRPRRLEPDAPAALTTSGWRLSRRAWPRESGWTRCCRRRASIESAVVLVRSLPDFKSTEAVAYPLAVLGRAFVAETPRGVSPGSEDRSTIGSPSPGEYASLVLLCDDLFAEAMGARCGGPAEETVAPDTGRGVGAVAGSIRGSARAVRVRVRARGGRGLARSGSGARLGAQVGAGRRSGWLHRPP